MKLLTKLLLIVLGAVTGMVLLGGFAVTSLRTTMLQERQQSMRLLVKMATRQVEHFQGLEKSGKLSRDDAQTAAKDVLRAMREGENYVFVRAGDKMLTTIVHPDPRKEGKSSNGGMLPNGQSVIDVYTQALQNTDFAFVSIYTKKPTGDVAVPKLSAIQFVPDWNWLIGSGDFVDDIDRAFWKHIIEFLIIGGIVLLVVIVLAIVLARGIIKQLGGEPRDAADSMRSIASGNLGVEIPLKGNDNSSLMASLKLMQMKLINLTSAIQKSHTSLGEQINIFTIATKTYAETKSDQDLNVLLQSVHKLLKTGDVLAKAVSRFKL